MRGFTLAETRRCYKNIERGVPRRAGDPHLWRAKGTDDFTPSAPLSTSKTAESDPLAD